jgi:stage II sporulation protein D
MNKFMTSVIFSFLGLVVLAQEISVALYYDRKPQGVTLTVQKGKYFVYDDRKIVDTLEVGQNINIVKESDYLVYRNRAKAFATDKEIRIVNSGEASFFVNYTGSVEAARCYEGWLKVTRHDYFIFAINYVNIESYVAGIVEAEGASITSEEYYKVMAVMLRTATVFNLSKHNTEGFDFCDGSHCQIYKNKASNRVIIQGTKKTANMVMVDKYTNVIQPLYHLNSGGYTADGYHVLNKKVDYLKPVKDTFAVYGKNYSWKLLIPGIEWQEFLVKRGSKAANTKLVKDLIVKMPSGRISAYKIGADSVKLAAVRSDLGWKSSYFDMSLDKSGVITVNGKGSGHGAGLSQESANTMASKGYTYDRILNYFFKDVHIVNLNNLNVYTQMEKKTQSEKP